MTNPKGKFVYSRDLYNFLKHNPDKINESDKQMYEHIFQIFLDVSRESSIYESYCIYLIRILLGYSNYSSPILN